VVRRSVGSTNLKNEEAMARVGLQHRKKKIEIKNMLKWMLASRLAQVGIMCHPALCK